MYINTTSADTSLVFAGSEEFIEVETLSLDQLNISDIKLAKFLGSNCIELHTGKISNKIKKKLNYSLDLIKIKKSAKFAKNIDLKVHAGHGIDYQTAKKLSKIKEIEEYNIGHFIIGESIFKGFKNTIRKFKKILK